MNDNKKSFWMRLRNFAIWVCAVYACLLVFDFIYVKVTGQTPQQTLTVVTYSNITSTTRLDGCDATYPCIDNRSQFNKQSSQSSYRAIASGVGSWSVDMQWADNSSAGPWTSFGSTAQVSQASTSGIGYGIGPSSIQKPYHDFIRFVMTGNVIVQNYSGTRQFWWLPSVAALAFPITASQGGTVGAFVVDQIYNTVSAGCSAANSSGITLMLTTSWNALTTQTLNCNIQAESGGILRPASAQTVTISGTFSGSITQHFNYSSGGSIVITGALPAFYPQWAGALCDGSSNDSSAFTNTIATAPSGAFIPIPQKGCVLNTGVTVNKTLNFSAGGATNAPGQILAGANSITLITVSANGARSTFSNLQFDANSHTNVIAHALTSASYVTFDKVIWNGAFAPPVAATFSLFATFKDIHVQSAASSMTFAGDSNILTFINAGFNGNGGVFLQNGITATFVNVTMECGATLAVLNWYGLSIEGGDFENVGCSHMNQYIALGSPAGAAPVYGATIKGVNFGGNSSYAVQIGPMQGFTFESNIVSTDTAGLAYNTTGSFANNRDIKIGSNVWNIGGSGYDESKIITYIGGYPDTLASNTTAMQISPQLFSKYMPVPGDSHIPNSDMAIYWDGSTIKMKSKTSGGVVQNDFMLGRTHILDNGGAGLFLDRTSATPRSWLFYVGSDGSLHIYDYTGSAERFIISTTGVVTIPGLSGVGTRYVCTNAVGTLLTGTGSC